MKEARELAGLLGTMTKDYVRAVMWGFGIASGLSIARLFGVV